MMKCWHPLNTWRNCTPWQQMRSTKSANLIGHIKFLPWGQLDGCSMTRPFLSRVKGVACETTSCPCTIQIILAYSIKCYAIGTASSIKIWCSSRRLPQLWLVSCPAYFSHAEGKNSLVNGLFRFCSKRHVGGAPIRLLHENDVTYA